MARLTRGLPSAGLFAGPLAWFAAQTSKYIAVPWTCAHELQLTHPITLAAFGVVAIGAWLSWRAMRAERGARGQEARGGEPRRFVAGLGVGMALLFGLLILLQGSAALVIDGCAR